MPLNICQEKKELSLPSRAPMQWRMRENWLPTMNKDQIIVVIYCQDVATKMWQPLQDTGGSNIYE